MLREPNVRNDVVSLAAPFLPRQTRWQPLGPHVGPLLRVVSGRRFTNSSCNGDTYRDARIRCQTRKSGGVASPFSAGTISSKPITVCSCEPSRRTETLRASASRMPTARMTGTFASECSRTL